jgi:3-dehydroquinate synthase
LDFGHWSAHKLEHLTNYEVRHGEAVAMGMALDIAYGYNLGLISKDNRDRIIKLIRMCGFAIAHDLFGKSELNPDLYDGIREFREHLGGELTLTMIQDIGKAIDVHEVDKSHLDKAVQYLNEIDAN